LLGRAFDLLLAADLRATDNNIGERNNETTRKAKPAAKCSHHNAEKDGTEKQAARGATWDS